MTTDTRTPEDIERDIEHERARMAGTINNLQQKFSVDGIVRDVGRMFQDQGGEMGQTIRRTLGRNPAALAVVGVGLAWLLMGKSSNGADRDQEPRKYGFARASDQWDQDAMPKAKRAGDQPYHDGDRYWFGDPPEDSRIRSSSKDGMMASIRSGAASVAETVSDAASGLRDRASDLTDRLMHGTDGLSDEAKDRVAAARRAANDARIAAGSAMQRGQKAATSMFDDQPMVMGAIALALGAAVGSALPRSQVENDTLGDTRDRLFDEAQTVFREERAKAMSIFATATDTAKDAMKDAGSDLANLLPEGKTVGNVIVDHVTDVANRVVDSAKEEADRISTRRT